LHKTKVILGLIILFAFIVLTAFVFSLFFSEWSFINGTLTISVKIITSFAFWGLLFCIIIILKANKILKIVCGILFSLLFSFSAYFTAYPFDTTTEPYDIRILRTDEDGKKLVISGYKNVKTNAEIQDTVLVQDIFVFRRLYYTKNGKGLILSADRESPLGWIYLEIYEDSSFQYTSKGLRKDLTETYSGNVEIRNDSMFFNYRDSIPKAGKIAIFNDKVVAYIDGEYPEKVEIKLNKLKK